MENKEIILINIKESKKRIKDSIKKDNLIIFFTRIVEDLKKHQSPNFYGRIKDIYSFLYPYKYTEDPKRIFEEIKKQKLISEDGLNLTENEIKNIKEFLDNLDEKCKLKNKDFKLKSELILNNLIHQYFPNSSKIIEPYILGKLISAVGGIDHLYRMPSSTIQLIGAEKALFRHLSKNKPSPKYGLIYYSQKIQDSKNKGKTARQISNKLAISIKQDYFQKFKT
jgi:nucleolar protein 56